MDETRIHTGTRIKLKKLDEGSIPEQFLTRLREYAHGEPAILAVFIFALQRDDDEPQPAMVIAIKSGLFSKGNETFLNIVDELQLMLPDDLSFNLYRFDTSDVLAAYCVHSVEPAYLRTAAWLEKQRKRHPTG